MPTTETTTATAWTTKQVAAKFNMKPTALRRVLRSMPEYADGVHTNYRWTGEKDPAIAKISSAIAAHRARAAKAKEAAQAALAAKRAEEAKPAAQPTKK